MDIIGKRGGRHRPSLHYNCAGWSALLRHLQRWNVSLCEFSGFNDGERLSSKTCRTVARVLKANYGNLPATDQEWLRGHARTWERLAKAGGAEQW